MSKKTKKKATEKKAEKAKLVSNAPVSPNANPVIGTPPAVAVAATMALAANDAPPSRTARAARVVAVVTCMGRLEHLKQTLPALLAEMPVVLVDWSCPDKCGTWASALHSLNLTVLTHPGERFFDRCKARNEGAAAAVEQGADWLCFVDADTLVAKGFGDEASALAEQGQFAIMGREDFKPSVHGLTGGLLVSAADFARVGGYDERFRDYGAEDIYLRACLKLSGLQAVDFSPGAASPLEHNDQLRSRFLHRTRAYSSVKNSELFHYLIQQKTGKTPEKVAEIQDILFRFPPGARR